ncbi:hypothetical protein [Streptomyces sp. NPDC001450]
MLGKTRRAREAVQAYERYLELTDEDGFGVAARITGLRRAAERERELLALLQRQCPRATDFARGPATDVSGSASASSVTRSPASRSA